MRRIWTVKQREQRARQAAEAAAQAAADYDAEYTRVMANRERLKALRLAREHGIARYGLPPILALKMTVAHPSPTRSPCLFHSPPSFKPRQWRRPCLTESE